MKKISNNKKSGTSRFSLVRKHLKKIIYLTVKAEDHPDSYGKSWRDVAQRSPIFVAEQHSFYIIAQQHQPFRRAVNSDPRDAPRKLEQVCIRTQNTKLFIKY